MVVAVVVVVGGEGKGGGYEVAEEKQEKREKGSRGGQCTQLPVTNTLWWIRTHMESQSCMKVNTLKSRLGSPVLM
ncbi:hypothetical protein E2C01_058696 [Portunus trituberculatus]|uniref:Uncharacterized protein n=1 Tax=Portunus trituberculatus TaxID=210409 RepID=A0A5B7H654_PORTR|nr:hypothetical protein [Portunus trituberculatus]